ncbi:MAG: hypothetical protein KJ964_08090 [Verrucomicrobia bacterium]|nr:hypothetical protein [Verrucomicrobiota bacterium]
MQTIITLRTFSVPLGEIADLFTKEQIVLRLLKVDALGATSTWYLDQCADKGHKERRLLLTGYDVGFPIDSKVIQPNLDFGVRKKELFSGKEMGEDVRRALDSYLRLLAKIMARVDQERPVLNQALQWAKETLGKTMPVCLSASFNWLFRICPDTFKTAVIAHVGQVRKHAYSLFT